MSDSPDAPETTALLNALAKRAKEYVGSQAAGGKLLAALFEGYRDAIEKSHSGIATLVCEMLSAHLRQNLIVLMRKSDHKMITKRLFEDYGPLNNIRSRIDLAYALEVIDTQTYRDLVLMNSIRVKFAHALSVRKFSDGDIADLIYKLHPAGKKAVEPATYIAKAMEIAAKLGQHFDFQVEKLRNKGLET